MESKNRIPFPQADDMNKIFLIINVNDVNDILDKNNMKVILGDITERQVQYYISAAMFLDVLDKNKSFTNFGKSLRNLNEYDQKIQIAKKIISKDVFGDVFFAEFFLGVTMDRDEIEELMRSYISFDSDTMYKRRAQTVLKWIEWIFNNKCLD